MTARSLRRALLLIVATLVGLGCIVVYSATAIRAVETYGHSLWYLAHHLLAIGLGLALALGCLSLPSSWLRHSAKVAILLGGAALITVFLCGSEIGGARRWFRIGHLSVEPSEFAQLALVLYLADFLARKHAILHDWREGFLPPMLVTGAMAGLALIQPNLGTAIVMGTVALLMLVIAKARWKHVAVVTALGAVALVVLIFGEEYRRRRMLAFLNPQQDPLGAGFQILQSYLALANGGLVGQGIGASMQKLFYLPGADTDFIFAIIGEELGFLGTTTILALFALLVTCGVRLAQMTEEPFSKYLICGCVGLIGFQAIIHMAVVTGLLPTKGLPLPLVSYGGTAIVMNLVACGLMFRASRHGERYAEQSAIESALRH